MPSFDTIFFDIDGTLVDATADIAAAMNYALEVLGYPKKPKEVIDTYIGTGVKDLISKSLGSNDAALIERGVEIYGKRYEEHPADRAIVYPGVRETLEALKSKRKFILTNRYARYADVLLKSLDLRRYFEEIFGGDDDECVKPNICLFERIASRIDFDKARAIIVGDMGIDIMAGKNAGIKTCWISHGLGQAEEARKLRPDYMIDDIRELKRIVA